MLQYVDLDIYINVHLSSLLSIYLSIYLSKSLNVNFNLQFNFYLFFFLGGGMTKSDLLTRILCLKTSANFMRLIHND